MDLLSNALILGVVSGLLYAVSGAGLVLIYRTSGYVSFAQGDISAIGLFVAYGLYTLGAPYPVIALTAVLVCAIVAGILGSGVVLPVEKHGPLAAAMATIALGIFIQGAATASVGNEPRAFPSASQAEALRIGSVSIQGSQVIAVAVTIVIFLAMGMAFKKMPLGIVLRAVNDDLRAAKLMGIPAQRLKLVSWVLAGALAGLAGLFIVPIVTLTPTSVNAILLFGFCSIVVGGFESVLGALVGGLLIGLASNLTAAFISPNLITTALYLVLLGVLLVRPHGILGRRPLQRV